MVAIQVRGVSQETRDALAGEAERRGQSLQLFLGEVLEREAASAQNLSWVAEMRGRQIPAEGAPSSRDTIRSGWRDRDQSILDAIGHADLPLPE